MHSLNVAQGLEQYKKFNTIRELPQVGS